MLIGRPQTQIRFCLFFPQKLKNTESDRLHTQIQAYLDNMFDVGQLMEDSDTKNVALERVTQLEETLYQVEQKAVLALVFQFFFHFISFILVVKPRTLRKVNLITELARNPMERRQGRKFQF